MDFTKGAKDLIDKNIRDIAGYMTLGHDDRIDLEKVLKSSFYENSEAKARERGSAVVAEEDVLKAVREQGTPQEIASAYMSSYAGELKRAGFWRRSLAFIIDMVICALLMVILASPFVAIYFIAFSPEVDHVIHVLDVVSPIVAIGVLACYFVVLEGRFGRTPGKYAMGLKVLKTDGMPINYKDALLRNIPKFFSNFVFIDALIMLVFFYREKQRGFDKVADTIVVRLKN